MQINPHLVKSQQIRFNEPMSSIISDQEAQCRNVDNMSAYEFRREANATAFNAPDCYSQEGGIMGVSGGASDRVPPSRLIDLETQIRRGANTVTSCRLYRPDAASSANNIIRKVMDAPLVLPPDCTGRTLESIQAGKKRTEFPEYSFFQPFADGLAPLPSGQILPGIDTRRELKDAWKTRNVAKPAGSGSVAFTPGTWTGPYGDSVRNHHGKNVKHTQPTSRAKPRDIRELGSKSYGELLEDVWRRKGCESMGC